MGKYETLIRKLLNNVNILRDPFMWLWAILKFRIKKIDRITRIKNKDLIDNVVSKEWLSQGS